ncbi:MAG: hypothetical protein Q8L40_04085 [Burkholderiales bacterium]|nr:hypothetical protein [Burkholderiales bacterium]
MITFTILMVLGAYLLAAALVTWVVLTRQKNRKAKWLAGFFSMTVFVLIPTWDWALGSIYFSYLCQADAGYKIYQTVKLGHEFYDEKGSARFIAPQGDINWEMLRGRYIRKVYAHTVFPKSMNVKKFHWIIEDQQTQSTLAVLVRPDQGPGWVGRLSGSGEGPGRHCENQDFKSEYLEMIRKVFVPDSSQNQEKTKTP